MNTAGYEYAILLPNGDYDGNWWMSDRIHADNVCPACKASFGYHVPIVLEDGELRRHLSCAMEWQFGREQEPFCDVCNAPSREDHRSGCEWWMRKQIYMAHPYTLDKVESAAKRSGWLGDWCQRCDRRNPVSYYIDDDAWGAVVRGRWNILCPSCFDEEAQAAGISYSFPFPLSASTPPHAAITSIISWSDWATTVAPQGDRSELPSDQPDDPEPRE